MNEKFAIITINSNNYDIECKMYEKRDQLFYYNKMNNEEFTNKLKGFIYEFIKYYFYMISKIEITIYNSSISIVKDSYSKNDDICKIDITSNKETIKLLDTYIYNNFVKNDIKNIDIIYTIEKKNIIND